MISLIKDRISILSGYANLFELAALTEGADGYIDSSTPVLGRRSLEFFHAATSGDVVKARDLKTKMSMLNAGFFSIGTFSAGIKVVLDMLGRQGGLPPRSHQTTERTGVRSNQKGFSLRGFVTGKHWRARGCGNHPLKNLNGDQSLNIIPGNY